MDQLGNTICILQLAMDYTPLHAASSWDLWLPGLLAGSCFVYPDNGCFSRYVTAGPAGDRIKKSSALEENLDVIKLRDAQGCLTFIAVPILL